jgi:dehydrogenase/reductase SDR family protein 12
MQGADTALWLAISAAARDFPSGSFYQDRVPVEKHLPLAWTRTSETETEQFMAKLKNLAETISGSSTEDSTEN